MWAPLIIVVTVGLTFLPALHNQFIAWDDPDNFTNNLFFQGFNWLNIKWMWTSFHMGVYIPLTWMSLACDYTLWGMNPVGYHLTNVVLHMINALLMYRIALSLLSERERATETQADKLRLSAAAVVAALCFAIHPLRVESVAWATERRDVLSGLFFLLAVLLYLKPGRRNASLGAYILSLLSKASGVMLPVLLIVIDVYRFFISKNKTSSWKTIPWKTVVLDKWLYLLIALPFAAAAIYGQKHDAAMAPLNSLPLSMRLAIMSHSILFYLLKTAVPVHLTPLYPLPDLQTLTAWPYPGYVLLIGLISWLLVLNVSKTPALGAAWVWYLIALFPVSGFFQSGGQFAADRYSYIPCMSWAILAGGCFFEAWKWAAQNRRGLALVSASVLLFTGLSVLTRNQIRIWHDTLSFWTYARDMSPTSVSAHNNVGAALAEQGRLPEAIDEFRAALALDPTHPGAQRNLKRALRLQHS